MTKKEHLVDALAASKKDRFILDRLVAEEIRRQELVRELEHLATAAQVTSLDEARLKREMKARLADSKRLLDRHISSARRLLRPLKKDPLRCEAVREGNQKEYRITGTGNHLPPLPKE